jgi:DNA-binding response OmpR family regulator
LDKNKKLSILLIEDNGMFLTIAVEMLKGHDVIAVKTAKEGIESYKDASPDITFLDIALPDGNGHEILKQIKKINPDAYVIMMTGSRLREDVIMSIDEGAEGYITKPFSDGMMRECIKEFYDYRNKKLEANG